ncbi:MAG: hypothetical protein E6G48_01570 [Actinobacteria bacterium]|nr:MAG: hypothetical protein E6G48_01570 [Actinomycetota bacterium]
MESTSVRPGYELWRPNREKAETKTMKAIVSFVLLVSAGLLVVITIGGWTRLEGSSVAIMTLLWAGLYVLFALLVARWNRGVLPVASALAIVLAIVAGVAAPGWFARSKSGFSPPPLPDDLLGLLTIIVVAVQLLLIAVAMVGFNQNWHVEEERPVGGVPLAGEDEDAALPPEEEEALPEEDDETLPRLEDESLPPRDDQHR